MNFAIDLVAKKYVDERFPQASNLEKEKIINDWIQKLDASNLLVADFKKRIGNPTNKKIIDVGSGPGGVSIAFSKAGALATGVDIEKELIDISKNFAVSEKVKPEFYLYDGSHLPFPDNYFDYGVSVSVLEHTSDPALYLSEIHRVLKPGGMVYLGFPNKLWPKETHTQIWFLTYLPGALKRILIKLMNRNPIEDNNLHFYSYYELEDLIAKIPYGGFDILEEAGESKSFLKKAAKSLLKFIGVPYKVFLPHILVILKKQ